MAAAASAGWLCGKGNACVDTVLEAVCPPSVEWGWQSDPELVNSQIGKLGDPANTEPIRTKTELASFWRLATHPTLPLDD